MAQEPYVKVEDTLPPRENAKDVSTLQQPVEIQKKEPRTIGSFAASAKKTFESISEPNEKENKELKEIVVSTDIKNKEQIFIEQEPLASQKSSSTINTPLHDKKESEEYIEPQSIVKKSTAEINPISNQNKNSTLIDEKVSTNKKTQTKIDDIVPAKKVEIDYSNKSEVSHVVKDEDVINVNGVYKTKDGKPVAVFKDHLEKNDSDILMETEHDSKLDNELKTNVDSLSKTESKINATTKYQLKTDTTISPTTTSVSKKTIGENIDGEIISQPDQYKYEITPELTKSLGSGTIDNAQKLNKSEINENITDEHQAKESPELTNPEKTNKEDTELELTSDHNKKTEYTYDEILNGYLSDLSNAVITKQPTPANNSVLNTKDGKVFNENTHVDFNQLPHVDKETPTTNAYSTELTNKNSKGFNDILPYDIPVHLKSVKESSSGLPENDVPYISGFDANPSDQSNNYQINITNDNRNEKSEDLVNTKIIENNDTDNVSSDESGFDDLGYIRTSKKLGDESEPIKRNESETPREITGDTTLAEVRNSDAYLPKIDWTTFIPPRTGVADLVKTAIKNFNLNKYTSTDQDKPDMNDDLLRFGQRALTGELARYVYSRLYSSVLLGTNFNKIKESLERPVEISATGVAEQADKIFDILSPAVNFVTADPSELVRDKEKMAYKGILPGMGNQINRTAVGIYGSMENYYHAVRSTILNRISDKYADLAVANAKIADYTAKSQVESDDTEKEKQDKSWSKLYLNYYKDKGKRIAQNILRTEKQYKTIIASLNSPTEYDQYSDDILALHKGNKAYSIYMKRSEEGPNYTDDGQNSIADSHLIENTKYDWRGYNLNKKPATEDDIKDDSTNYGFVYANTSLNIVLKDRLVNSLKELPSVYAGKEYQVANDLMNYKYILTQYGNHFNDFVDEISNYYTTKTNKKVKDSNIISTYSHYMPAKEVAQTYVNAMSDQSTNYSYSIIDNQGNEKKNPNSERSPILSDPHLTSLFEKQLITPFDVRLDFYNTIQDSQDENLMMVKDQFYKLDELDYNRLNFDSNKNYFNYIKQASKSINDSDTTNMTKDEIEFEKRVLYQAALNYFSQNMIDQDMNLVRNVRQSMTRIATDAFMQNGTDNPLGSNYNKFSSLYSFSWFNNQQESGDRNKSFTDVFVESKNEYSVYSDQDENSIDANYVKAFGLTDFEMTSSEEIIKTQVDIITNRSKSKKLIPLGPTLVSSDENNYFVAKLVQEDAETIDGTENSISRDKVIYVDGNNPNSEQEMELDKTFIIENDETIRNKNSDYYKKIIEKRKKVFPTVTNNMKLVIDGKTLGTVRGYEVGLGGILVSTGFNQDRDFTGAHNLYFMIPFEFNPEISGESRSANWNSVTAFGRTHEHFVYANSSARSIQLKTTYGILDYTDKEIFDKFGENKNSESSQKEAGIERNDAMDWAKDWTEDYLLMILNMYRSLVLPVDAYNRVTPPVVSIEFGKYLGTYTRKDADNLKNAKWIVSEYSIDPNFDMGYTLSRTPRLFDVSLTLKEVYDGYHDAQDFWLINKHLEHWAKGAKVNT